MEAAKSMERLEILMEQRREVGSRRESPAVQSVGDVALKAISTRVVLNAAVHVIAAAPTVSFLPETLMSSFVGEICQAPKVKRQEVVCRRKKVTYERTLLSLENLPIGHEFKS